MTQLLTAATARRTQTAPAGWPSPSHCSLHGRTTARGQLCVGLLPHRHARDAAHRPTRGVPHCSRSPRRRVCCAVRDPGVLYVPGPPKRPDGRFSAAWRRLQRSFPVLKYEELLKRVAGTMLLVGLVRLGHHVPMPGVPPMLGRFTPGAVTVLISAHTQLLYSHPRHCQ